MKERLAHVLTSLTAKYVAVFVLLVAVPAIGISAYLLNSAYNDNKAALIKQQQEEAQVLATRIDQTLLDAADRLRSFDGVGLDKARLEAKLLPFLTSNLTPVLVFYMNGGGKMIACFGPRCEEHRSSSLTTALGGLTRV